MSGKPVYTITMKILDTQDYGIPQSRKRLYIVGLKTKEIKQRFRWPPKSSFTEILYVREQKKLRQSMAKITMIKWVFATTIAREIVACSLNSAAS